MPNWVYNGLTIEGSPEQITKLVEQVNKPFYQDIEALGDLSFGIKRQQYTNPIFAFHNIYSYKEAGITDEEYRQQPARSELGVNDPNWWSDTQRISQTDKSWYNFNNREWGTKWDVAVEDGNKYPDTYIEGPTENGENLVVYYNFNTAWSPPVPAIQKLSAQYPTLLFTLSYEEETGWGGELECLRGEVISHGDYESKCRDCDEENTMEYCENDCGEICSSCNYLGEAELDCVAECPIHMQYLDSEHVPDYRLANS